MPHPFQYWKPGNRFITKSVLHTKSCCLFLSSNLKQSEELTLVNVFHAEHLLRRRQPVPSGSRRAAEVSREEGESGRLTIFFVSHYPLSCFDLGFTHNQAGKTDLTWTLLLQKLMTKRTFLVFSQLSQRGRNNRIGSWRCGNIRTHFLFTNLSHWPSDA